jgi:hypothetical protein
MGLGVPLCFLSIQCYNALFELFIDVKWPHIPDSSVYSVKFISSPQPASPYSMVFCEPNT